MPVCSLRVLPLLLPLPLGIQELHQGLGCGGSVSIDFCYPGHWPFTAGSGCRKEEEGVGARGGEGDELRRERVGNAG